MDATSFRVKQVRIQLTAFVPIIETETKGGKAVEKQW